MTMKMLILLLLVIPSVFAVEVPLVLNVNMVQVEEFNETPALEHSFELANEETPGLPVTAAVAYEESASGTKWALWLLLGVAAAVAVILVLRR